MSVAEIVSLKYFNPLLGFIALVILSSIRLDYFSGRLANQIKHELAAHESGHAGDHNRVPGEYIERMIPLLEQRLPSKHRTAAGIAGAIRNIWSMVWFTPPGALASTGLLLLYLSSLGIGAVATLVVETPTRQPRVELLGRPASPVP